MNDTKCTETWANFNAACSEAELWDGNSSMPICTEECKKRLDELGQNAISKHIKCCNCGDDENVTETMMCNLVKRNIEELCELTFLEDCQLYKTACEHERSTEVVTDSESNIMFVCL